MKQTLKNRKQKGAGLSAAGSTTECDICGETKVMVSAFECMHTMCKDCIDTWILRSPTCPECRSEVKDDYLNAVLSARPREREQSRNQTGELMHFMPLMANNPITGRASVLDAVVTTGAVLSIRNYLFDSIRIGTNVVEDVVGLSILFLFAFMIGSVLRTGRLNRRERGNFRGLLRMIIGVTLLGSEMSLFQNRMNDIINTLHSNNQVIHSLNFLFPRRGGGDTPEKGHVKAEIHIELNLNAKRKYLEPALLMLFHSLFDREKHGLHLHNTIITLPDVEYKMKDMEKTQFYKKLMQLNTGKKTRTIKHGRSSSGRTSRSSRRSA
jgi:hypothetical protein